MDTNTLQSSTTIQLAEQQGAFIVCEEGQLWLTDNGDDIVLASGERHQIQSLQPVVIESLRKNSRFHLEGVQAQHTTWFQKMQHLPQQLWHAAGRPHAHA